MPTVVQSAAEEVLVHLLKTNEATNEHVRIDGDQFRIAPDQAPSEWRNQSCYVYEQQSDNHTRLVNGARSGKTSSRFSLYCVNRNRATSRLMAQDARRALTVNNRQTIAGVLVLQVFVANGERDESIPGIDGQDAPDRYRTLDVIVHHIFA